MVLTFVELDEEEEGCVEERIVRFKSNEHLKVQTGGGWRNIYNIRIKRQMGAYLLSSCLRTCEVLELQDLGIVFWVWLPSAGSGALSRSLRGIRGTHCTYCYI